MWLCSCRPLILSWYVGYDITWNRSCYAGRLLGWPAHSSANHHLKTYIMCPVPLSDPLSIVWAQRVYNHTPMSLILFVLRLWRQNYVVFETYWDLRLHTVMSELLIFILILTLILYTRYYYTILWLVKILIV